MKLDEAAINRIAAGEVVERPASVVKELVENSIDAGAGRIAVTYSKAGRSLIRVVDDGFGIAGDDLPLAVSRHATSKSDGADLLKIDTLGFRGEALPSMGAVGRLTLTSRLTGAQTANSITVNAGAVAGVQPAALGSGTVVELTELFRATPARLKFLHSDRSESRAIADAVRVLALSQPTVRFELIEAAESGKHRSVLKFEPGGKEGLNEVLDRMGQIVGKDFPLDAIPVDAERCGCRIAGYCSLPTYNRGNAGLQFSFVNGRPVRDKIFFGALKAAYADHIPTGRFAVSCLFLDCPPEAVDVNVHPAKTEVRFREASIVRGLIMGAIKAALAEGGHRSSSTLSSAMLGAGKANWQSPSSPTARRHPLSQSSPPRTADLGRPHSENLADPRLGLMEPNAAVAPPAADDQIEYPLGAARAQLHGNYIVAETEQGMVLVDQHAAHERLVYEDLKAQYAASRIESQPMLAPTVVDLPENERSMILELADTLGKMGLTIEPFGPQGVAITSVPAVLGGVGNGISLIRDILDGFAETGTEQVLEERINAVLSRISCHGSIRSGRKLTAEEMNSLLRSMEKTPGSGQCNHGRPTHISLSLSDIERLFKRS